MSNGQVDELTGRRVNTLVARRDRVTDEQVREVTERGEWVGDGKGWIRRGRGRGGENGRHVRGRSILS